MTPNALYTIAIDKNKKEPSYIQLQKALTGQIRQGNLKSGDRLLSDNEMMRTFRLSRATVRQAVDELVKTGLVKRLNGKGTFVAERSRPGLDPIAFVHEAIPAPFSDNFNMECSCDPVTIMKAFAGCTVIAPHLVMDMHLANDMRALDHDFKDKVDIVAYFLDNKPKNCTLYFWRSNIVQKKYH